jgi:hypothetical protein
MRGACSRAALAVERPDGACEHASYPMIAFTYPGRAKAAWWTSGV